MVFLLTAQVPAQDLVRYVRHGVSFSYPKEWKVSAETRFGVTTISVGQAAGSQIALQLHPAGTNPVAARIQLDRALHQAHEGKVVEALEIAPKWKFSVGEVEGTAFGVKGEDERVTYHELFALHLPTKTRQACVVHFAYPAGEVIEARKAFAALAESLGDSGAKPPAKPGKPQPVVTPPIRLRRPIPEGWEVKPARKGEKPWADQFYAITELPAEVEGGFLVVRSLEESRSWLPGERVILERDCTVYAVLRSRHQGKVLIESRIIRWLGRDGWEEVEGAAGMSTPPGEAWGWRIIKRSLKQGDDFPPFQGMTWGHPVVFVFK
jgi:hypothetical protein